MSPCDPAASPGCELGQQAPVSKLTSRTIEAAAQQSICLASVRLDLCQALLSRLRRASDEADEELEPEDA